MTQRILALTLMLIGPADICSADNTPQLKGFADLAHTVQIATGFSDDKKAATVLFRNLEVDLGGRGGRYVNSCTTTVVLPLNVSDKAVRVNQDIRGFVSTQGSGRAVLVVQSGGKTTVIDLRRACSDCNKRSKCKPSEALGQAQKRAQEKAQASGEGPSSEVETDFFHRLETVIPKGLRHQVTLWLLAERDTVTEEAAVLLTVDSLDVEISGM